MLFSKRSKGGAHAAQKGSKKKAPAAPRYTKATPVEEPPATKPRAASRQKAALHRSLPFYAALTALTVFAWLLPLRPSYSLIEKRELEKFPDFSMQALLSGDWFDGINLWFSDTFPGREGFISANMQLTDLYGVGETTITGTVEEVAIPTVAPADKPLTLEDLANYKTELGLADDAFPVIVVGSTHSPEEENLRS